MHKTRSDGKTFKVDSLHTSGIENKTKDIHAVDKWARMLIKQLLEFHRVMWKQCCDLIAQANKQTYEGRQRQELLALCMYLKSNQDIIFDRDLHYFQRTDEFFTKSPIDNLLMWKR